MPTEDNPFAAYGVEPPRNTIFQELRALWFKQNEKQRNVDLAALLTTRCPDGKKVRPQHVSQWASGTDGRIPPWWIIMSMCELTGRMIVLSPASVSIDPIRKSFGG